MIGAAGEGCVIAGEGYVIGAAGEGCVIAGAVCVTRSAVAGCFLVLVALVLFSSGQGFVHTDMCYVLVAVFVNPMCSCLS